MPTEITIEQISDLLDKKLDEKLDQKLDEKLAPIFQKLAEHSKILSKHSRELKSLKKTQDMMLVALDGEQMKQRKRLDRVEERLQLVLPI